MRAEIIRNTGNPNETQGKWASINEREATMFSCDTLERLWLNNQQGKSCIPPGVYIVKKVPASHIPYPHFSITNVANRAGVAIHILNLFTESEGCVGVGRGWGDINKDGIPDLLNSAETFKHLWAVMPDEFLLTIK